MGGDVTNELPDNQQDRVSWVIRAPDNEELRRRYDLWARQYDDDVGNIDDYLAPRETVAVAAKTFDTSARIMDAGAGTGLVGRAMKEVGFETLIAADYSKEMLKIAASKSIYAEIHHCDFTKETHLQAGSFDGLVTCGTTSQVPCASLREYTRVLRPGGKMVFAAATDAWRDCGYADVFAELESAGQISLLSRGESFQMLPTTEPEFYCEILVIEKH